MAAVVVTYNGARWIEEQLGSILAQSHPPDEIILSDDRSTDGTLEIARKVLLKSDVPVEIISVESRRGVISNLEGALMAATADVVVLADQDDVWAPLKLAVIHSWATQTLSGGWFSDGWIVDENGGRTDDRLWERAGFTRRLQQRWDSDPLGVLLKLPVVTGATLAFRREHLSFLLPLSRNGWHDYSISILLAATVGLEKCGEPLIYYRLHGANAAGLPAASRLARVQPHLTHRSTLERQRSHFVDLADRSTTFPQPEATNRLRKKADVLSRRASLPGPRPLRLPSVIKMLARGSYHASAQGFASAARDLFWP